MDDAPADAELNPSNAATAPVSRLMQGCAAFTRKAGIPCHMPPASERLQLVQSWGLAEGASLALLQQGELSDELVTLVQVRT